VRVIEHESGHYEVREVPYGKVYDWSPDRVVFQCDCGETHVSSGSAIVCSCGTVHTGDARDLRHEYFVFVEESDA
jgi:hypothetical protein